ncbi:unnamed protein product [Phytophthora fragariaefolia]|uniref:Unnamed protein product n=1 Tax=Phytophthora fragariaefolia TaxID=1490495 RepID=A0A9W6XBQ5_9STRA|nr:unnamed protein product [Phytophthora fragariaefolia]
MVRPSRCEFVQWVAGAWSTLSVYAITGRFTQTKLAPRDTTAILIQRLLTSSPTHSEPDWGSLVQRLTQSEVPIETINPARDIDADDDPSCSNSQAKEDDEAGFIGDDEGCNSDLDDTIEREKNCREESNPDHPETGAFSIKLQ